MKERGVFVAFIISHIAFEPLINPILEMRCNTIRRSLAEEHCYCVSVCLSKCLTAKFADGNDIEMFQNKFTRTHV